MFGFASSTTTEYKLVYIKYIFIHIYAVYFPPSDWGSNTISFQKKLRFFLLTKAIGLLMDFIFQMYLQLHV